MQQLEKKKERKKLLRRIDANVFNARTVDKHRGAVRQHVASTVDDNRAERIRYRWPRERLSSLEPRFIPPVDVKER